MASLTVSAMVTHLDNLVLDYIHRRPTVQVLVASPFYASNANKIDGEAILDITLEEIYLFHFMENRSFREKNFQSIMNSTMGNVQNKPNLQPPLPQLPVEIVEQILEFGSVKQLYRLRFLSRNINNRLCRRLQLNSRPPNVATQEYAEHFLRAFDNRIQHLKHPFRDVYCGRNWAAIPQVLEVVGPQLVVNLDTLEVTDLSRDVLARMTHVRSLHVNGLPNIAEIGSMRDINLPALRFLEILHKVGERDAVDFEHIKFWLQLAPSLRRIYSWIRTTLTPAQAISLFRSHASLSSMEFNEFVLSWKEEKMDVSLTMKHLGHENYLLLYAELLQTWSVSYYIPNQIPPLPRLTHLCLSNHRPGPLVQLQLKATPLLQHVTIGSSISNAVSTIYRDFVFESVVSLHLSDDTWAWSESHPPLFHLIFPQVQTLELSGFLPVEFINYFATHFQRVQNLKFMNFESETCTNLPLFQVRVPGRREIEWPFFKLPNLKTVEFSCDERGQNTVMTLVWLTLNKYIQPLLKLRIVQWIYRECEDDDDRALYYSMSHLKYHKKLEFSFGKRF